MILRCVIVAAAMFVEGLPAHGQLVRPPAPAAVTAQSPSIDDRVVVRIALDDVPFDLRGDIDDCAIEHVAGQRKAVFILPAERAAELGVAHDHLGTLAEHIRRFAPRKTLRNKPIPSIQRYLDDGPGRQAAGTDPCAGVGASLQPYDEYHNLAEGRCFLHNLADTYPDITDLRVIGQTLEGRDVLALRITDKPGESEADEQRILFTGVTHAREWVTHEMLLYLAEYLTSRYGTDERVADIVDHSEVWLVSVVNPDGFEYSWTNERMWRKNRRPGLECDGVDINRNYDYGWGPHSGSSPSPCSQTYRGAAAASEPETQVIQNLLQDQQFALGVSYHAYSQLVLYAWGHTTDVTAESYTSMRALANRYAIDVASQFGEVYAPGQSSYTIYLTNGDFDDYAYAAVGTMALTPELRPKTFGAGGFALPEDQILETCMENTAAALWLMEVTAAPRVVARPGGGALLPDPAAPSTDLVTGVTPVNQKPEVALGFPVNRPEALITWLDDNDHDAGSAPRDEIEGIGSGNGYRVVLKDPAVRAWAEALTSYIGLPRVFEFGAEVMLSNVDPGVNWIGVPGGAPVLLRDVDILERRVDDAGVEQIVSVRNALEDVVASSPLLDWTWRAFDADGTVHAAHPTGLGGAEFYARNDRTYEVHLAVPSYEFDSTSASTYLLRFPPPDFDCDDNGVADVEDIAGERGIDCNDNGVIDSCELNDGVAEDCDSNGILDGCEGGQPFVRQSQAMMPVDRDTVLTHRFVDVPEAASMVTVHVAASGDLASTNEHMDVTVNGHIAGTVFTDLGSDCSEGLDSDYLYWSAAAFNTWVTRGEAEVALVPSSGVSGGQCADDRAFISLSFEPHDGDCDDDGLLDSCQVNAGAEDCDANGVPDNCQINPDFVATSPRFAPLVHDLNWVYAVPDAPLASGPVTLHVDGAGDLASAGEHVTIELNGQVVGEVLIDGEDCGADPVVDDLVLEAAVFNSLLADQTARLRLVPASGVSDTGCASYIQVTLGYATAETDCDASGVLDSCEISDGLLADCDANGVADLCDIVHGADDCDSDGRIDACQVADGSATDCDSNAVLDSCDISAGAADCNANAQLDDCELADGSATDCDRDDTIDACQIAEDPAVDCDTNGVPDACDLASGSADVDGDGVLDSCEPTAVVGSAPPTGAIDARRPTFDGLPVGWSDVTMTFSSAALGVDSGDFLILSSSRKVPQIERIQIDGAAARLVLDGSLPPGHCTTFVHQPSGARIELGYLPADVDANGLANQLDILALIDTLNGVIVQPASWSCDIDRSGTCEPLDILMLIDLLNGAGGGTAWSGRTLPPCE